MSFQFRDNRGVLGPDAQIEIPNGANASTLVNMQLFEVVGVYGLAAAAATGNQTVWLTPPAPSTATGLPPLGAQYKVLGVSAYFDVASTSGVIDIEKTPSGTADGSGTSILSGTISTAAGARTNKNGSLAASATTLTLNAGDRLVIKHSGTQTGLVDLSVCIYVARIA